MIFVTVGSMLPYDRLVCVMDAWCAAEQGHTAFAQIGEGSYTPEHMQWARALPPAEFGRMIRSADIIVAHAGMGSIITAMEAGKPIVVMPRRVAYREVTTEHQVHTVGWLLGKPGIFVADDEAALPAAIGAARQYQASDSTTLANVAPPEFVARFRSFLRE